MIGEESSVNANVNMVMGNNPLTDISLSLAGLLHDIFIALGGGNQTVMLQPSQEIMKLLQPYFLTMGHI